MMASQTTKPRFKPELSVLTLEDGTNVLQLTGARVAQTNGGLALGAKRTLYVSNDDQNTIPSYAGTNWPHIQLGHLPDLPAGVSINQEIVDGVYVINGKPVYQYAQDASESSATGTVDNWRLIGITGIGIWEDPDNDGFDSSTNDASDLNNDAFPDDAAASLDSDGDGYPDVWNNGMSQSDSSSGLLIDIAPFDPTVSVDSAALFPEFADPSKREGLVGWFTVDSATLQLRDGKVKTWKNLIGGQQNFNQVNKTKMPGYSKESLSITFTGNEFLEMKQKKPTDNTIIIVANGRGDFFGDSSTYLSVRYKEVRLGTGEDTEALTRLSTDAANISEKVIYVLRNDATENTVKLKIGNQTIANRTNSVARKGRDNSMFIGKAGKVVSQGFRGAIYEVLIYNRVLSDKEVQEIQNEVSLRWDVTTSKPTEISVDKGYEGSTLGTKARPLKRLRDAFRKVFRGGRVKVKKGHYEDPMTVTENIVIEAEDGDVILGTPKEDQE